MKLAFLVTEDDITNLASINKLLSDAYSPCVKTSSELHTLLTELKSHPEIATPENLAKLGQLLFAYEFYLSSFIKRINGYITKLEALLANAAITQALQESHLKQKELCLTLRHSFDSKLQALKDLGFPNPSSLLQINQDTLAMLTREPSQPKKQEKATNTLGRPSSSQSTLFRPTRALPDTPTRRHANSAPAALGLSPIGFDAAPEPDPNTPATKRDVSRPLGPLPPPPKPRSQTT